MLSVTVAVTTGATLLITPVGSGPDPQPVRIYNASDATVYVGGADVTTAIGIPVTSTGFIDFVFTSEDLLYGIAASGTKEVRVLQGRKTSA